MIQPTFSVVGAESRPPKHRPLLRDLERSLGSGDLKDSELGPLVLQTLQQATDLDLVKSYDAKWITVGIRVADSYFRLIRSSAGQRGEHEVWHGDADHRDAHQRRIGFAVASWGEHHRERAERRRNRQALGDGWQLSWISAGHA